MLGIAFSKFSGNFWQYEDWKHSRKFSLSCANLEIPVERVMGKVEWKRNNPLNVWELATVSSTRLFAMND